MEPSRGKSNPGKKPWLVQVNRVPSRPPILLPARAQAVIAQGGSRAWGQSPTPRRASPTHTMVSESSQLWGQPFGHPWRAPPTHSMASESTQSSPYQESIVNMNWPVPNHDNVVGGQDGIPVAIPMEGQASNLYSMVFRPSGIPTTHRPRYVWSPITGYKLYWQPALGLRQAQRRALASTPREAPAHAPMPTNSPIPVEYGYGADQLMNSVDHLAFGERLHIQENTVMDNGSSDEGSTTNSPTTHHTMDGTNPWGSSDNSEDSE